jgi:hypothetical protein
MPVHTGLAAETHLADGEVLEVAVNRGFGRGYGPVVRQTAE